MTFLSLLLQGELGFICTFSKGPNLLRKSLYRGKLWGRFLKRPFGRLLIRAGATAQRGLLLSLLLHVHHKVVIACNGEPGDQREEALEAHFAVPALVQVLHYLVHGQGVFLIFQKSRELLFHEYSQVLLC